MLKKPPDERRSNRKTDTALVRENAGWMLAVARRILNDGPHAEDAVQNAFSSVFLKLDDFEGRSSIKTWMHRIVVNEALMILRSIVRKKETPIDPLLPQFDDAGCRIDQQLIEPETPESLLQSAETAAFVRDAIGKLPENYRIVLVLRDIEELSTREVGDALRLSEANVKVRLHRARAALKKLLEPAYRSGK